MPGIDPRERGVNEVSLADPEEQPRGRDEVAIEDLDQRKERREENHPGDPLRAEGARERRLRAEMAGDERLPGEDERDHGDDRHVEEASHHRGGGY